VWKKKMVRAARNYSASRKPAKDQKLGTIGLSGGAGHLHLQRGLSTAAEGRGGRKERRDRIHQREGESRAASKEGIRNMPSTGSVQPREGSLLAEKEYGTLSEGGKKKTLGFSLSESKFPPERLLTDIERKSRPIPRGKVREIIVGRKNGANSFLRNPAANKSTVGGFHPMGGQQWHSIRERKPSGRSLGEK